MIILPKTRQYSLDQPFFHAVYVTEAHMSTAAMGSYNISTQLICNKEYQRQKRVKCGASKQTTTKKTYASMKFKGILK